MTEMSMSRGHGLKIIKKWFREHIKKNCFTQRVVENYNGLPERVVEAETLMTFKTFPEMT